MLYNAVLRGSGGEGRVPPYAFPGGQWAGELVKGRFVATIHGISGGVIELAKLSYAAWVYRGFTGMKLPESFTSPDDQASTQHARHRTPSADTAGWLC